MGDLCNSIEVTAATIFSPGSMKMSQAAVNLHMVTACVSSSEVQLEFAAKEFVYFPPLAVGV